MLPIAQLTGSKLARRQQVVDYLAAVQDAHQLVSGALWRRFEKQSLPLSPGHSCAIKLAAVRRAGTHADQHLTGFVTCGLCYASASGGVPRRRERGEL